MQRKKLSADGMLGILRNRFEQIEEPRTEKAPIKKTDALMTALSAFLFKFDSFHTFYERLEDPEDPLRSVISSLYKVDNVPSPTRIKEIIDPLNSKELSIGFKDIFREIQRGKALEPYTFWNGHYLVSGDGSQYFESEKIHCKKCIVKKLKNGNKSYSHQMYAGAIIHPNMKQVIPLAPEAIQNSDGDTKNDCERNASARFLDRLRKDHPRANFIITEDGLAANAPHIKKIQSLGMKFILRVKPGDHKYLFNWVNALGDEMETVKKEIFSGKRVIRRTTQTIRYINDVPLNESHKDVKVNFLELVETVEKKIEHIKHDVYGDPTFTHTWEEEKKTKFTWISDIKIKRNNVFTIMQGGRKYWSIENETFNTLKNMGYNWEHNYGHGEENLATNFSLLMMLAFMIDQVQELCCPLFRKALELRRNCKKILWEKIRMRINSVEWIGNVYSSWEVFFKVIIYGPKALEDTG